MCMSVCVCVCIQQEPCSVPIRTTGRREISLILELTALGGNPLLIPTPLRVTAKTPLISESQLHTWTELTCLSLSVFIWPSTLSAHRTTASTEIWCQLTHHVLTSLLECFVNVLILPVLYIAATLWENVARCENVSWDMGP